MVGCDRVVCPLVLHATTIAHLDVLLCTLLFFLLCAVLLCGAVAVVCGCVLPPALPAPVGVCYGAPLYPCAFPVFFLGIIPAPYMGVLYAGLIRSLYTCPIFLGLLFMIRSVHTVKAGPWIPNVDFQKSA